MSNKLRVKIYCDGKSLGDVEFDQDVIKVGRLKRSHLHLDDESVGRMHAVIERTSEGYRLIDLGSESGSFLNGVQVNKNAMLPKTGTLLFGLFRVEFELDEALAQVDLFESFNQQLSEPDKDHHKDLCEALCRKLEEVQSSSVADARKMLARWSMIDDERKRAWLRLLIEEIRSCQKAEETLQRKRIATMLNLGMEGMEAIYQLEPDVALDKAYETVMEMALAKTGLTLFLEMGLGENMTKAYKAMPPAEQKKQRADVDSFLEVHHKLADRLQTAIVAGGSLVPAYMSRASGREPTDEDRSQWKAAFDQIKAQQKKANEAK